MTSRLALVAALLVGPTVVAARIAPAVRPTLPRVDYVPSDQFDEMLRFSNTMKSVGGTVAVAWDEQASYMLVRRTAPSEVEEHSRWDDVVIVRGGTGAIIFGSRLRGARVMAPGELRGGALVSREARVMRVGDLLRIPAGVPHAFVPSGAEPWVLMIVKVRRPNLPLKRAAE